MNYYDFAIKNLKTAQLHVEHNGDTDEIAVACQQYFEKAFRQLLLLRDGTIYKSHKLSFLVNKLSIPEFSVNENLLRMIGEYYFDKRYPNEAYIETSKDEALRVYNLAIELKPIIESYINLYSKSKENESVKRCNVFDDV